MTDALKAELGERIAVGNVLAVTGTGISIAATRNNPLASWTGLITNGIEHCVGLGLRDAEWGEQQKAQLKNGDVGDLLGVAEEVSHRLGWQKHDPCGGDWNGWLRKTIGTLRAQNPELVEAIRDLGLPIATLNYDDLLASCHDRAGRRNNAPLAQMREEYRYVEAITGDRDKIPRNILAVAIRRRQVRIPVRHRDYPAAAGCMYGLVEDRVRLQPLRQDAARSAAEGAQRHDAQCIALGAGAIMYVQ
jgi:hypothetical protein